MRTGKPPGDAAPIVANRPGAWPEGWTPSPLCGNGWNWSWPGGQWLAMRSPLAFLAALAGAGCTGLSLAVSWYLPELAILSATAAGFWWQVVKLVES